MDAVQRQSGNAKRGVFVAAALLLATGVAASQDQPPPPAQSQPAVEDDQQEIVSAHEEQEKEEKEEEEAPERFDLRTTEHLLDDWGGLRKELEEAGVSFRFRTFMVPQVSVWGGQNTNQAHTTTGQVDYAIEFDFEKLLELKGSTFFIRARQTWNDRSAGIGPDLGSLSRPYGGTGARDDNELYLDQWHWRQRFFDDRLELRLGLLDAGDYFDRNDYAEIAEFQFGNTALERSASIPLTTALGLYARVWPVDWAYLSATALDPDRIFTHNRHGTGGFDTAFHGEDRFRTIWELGLLPHELPGVQCLPGHYRFGGWMTPKPKTVFIDDLDGHRAPQTRSGDVGFYFNFDQLVWKENDDPKDTQGLGVFGRYAFAHPDVNTVNHFWSVGASYQGLIPSRDNDALGFGVAQIILSTQLRHNVDPRADRETIYDLYYRIAVAPWCSIAPDIQVITNPGGTKDAHDALVAGLRLEFDF